MENKARIYAVGGTLVAHALLLVLFLTSFLTYPPTDDAQQWPPMEEPEIVLEQVDPIYSKGEFVRMGDNFEEYAPKDAPKPSATESKLPTQNANDFKNAGEPAPQRKVTTSKRPSPMKVKEEKTGPTKREQTDKEEQLAMRQQASKKTVADATNRAFGGGKGKGTPGSMEGNSDGDGAVTGTPGNGLEGRSLEHFSRVRGRKLGVISIRVKVDSNGRVTSASFNLAGSSGAVAADESMRAQCLARTRECRFSVKEGAPVQSGTISWVFK